MFIIDDKGILITIASSFDGTYYYSKLDDCFYQKDALKLSEVTVKPPLEAWVKPQFAKFINGEWLQHTVIKTRAELLQQMVIDGKITQEEMNELL